MTYLRLIMHDQLNMNISALDGILATKDVILMCELKSEATRVKHHKKKLVLWFAAMRHFAKELVAKGYKVEYVQLEDTVNSQDLTQELGKAIKRHGCQMLIATQPSEYHLIQEAKGWEEKLNCKVELRSDNRFLASVAEFATWAEGRKELRMEYFYRLMRQKYNILLTDEGGPIGGKWNYDTDNRKKLPANSLIPSRYKAKPDDITAEVMLMVERNFGNHYGILDGFDFAVNRAGALLVLEKFVQERLENFGKYQDAMLQDEPWLYHSHISFYLNCGLLMPKECLQAAIDAYKTSKSPLNSVEGFIRQILGWREYIRGIYMLRMPSYAKENFFNAQKSLPEFFWHGKTEMNCLSQALRETKQNAYAHHIQRLMVIGNFALIAGLKPDEVNEWYWIVYADAYQWVELPNVTGMILFADGGYLASKPYAAGGSYINKMSNYCKSCKYKVAVKDGPEACPFNYLYWDFLARNRQKLANNRRLAMMYKTYDKMPQSKKEAIAGDSAKFLVSII